MSESGSSAIPQWPQLWPGTPVLYLINRLIRSEPWAVTTLAAHAGKSVAIELKPFTLVLTVTDGGSLVRAAQDAAIDLRIGVPFGQLSAMAMAPERAGNLVELHGDTAFAQALAALGQHLRPDLEEGLSRLFGDVVAMRLLGLLHQIQRGAIELQQRLSINSAEYLLDESDALIRPVEVDLLSARVRVLRDDLARLEKRIERLSPIQ